mgnify:CR=1 FL=1
MEVNKKQNLKRQIIGFIDKVLEIAEKEDKLDYIDIEIKNHQGNLQMEYVLKNRMKIY